MCDGNALKRGGLTMSKLGVLLLLSMGVPAYATTYTIAAGSNTDAIQAILYTAGSSPGNTVAFGAGSYSLAYTLSLPCSYGTVYTGPNVGLVTQTNLPTALLTSTVSTNYALATNSNGTSFTGAQGCTIQYLRFTGTQGGVFVNYPSSGIFIQENAFDNNNPPNGGYSSEANIWVDGENYAFTPDAGVTNLRITWNTFFDNCADIRANAYPDSGGGCASTWVNGYNNYLTWSNNTVNLTEEGLKLSEPTAGGIGSLNADVENNNMQGNSRILVESQQDTNGVGTYSHNAFYQPFNPSFNTFELSVPEWTTSISPTHVVDDNAFIANVPITLGGSGGHYGIGLELWGSGSIATNNLFQGGNGPDNCAAGWGCSGWAITVGEPYTNATITGNYFSGTDAWAGSATNMSMAVTYEDDGSSSNPGIILSPNTVVQNSTTIATAAPTISVSGSTVTLKEPNSAHNVSIFYTTDGTTPAIFGPGRSAGTSRVYSAPFTASGSTIKAIASWGQGANQGITFPSLGYVPSTIVTSAVSGTTAPTNPSPPSNPSTPTLVSAYLGTNGNVNTMVAGKTLEFSVYGVYSDGSTKLLPDLEGNTLIQWNTSNHGVAKVSSIGKITAISAGAVNVEARVGAVGASPWTVTVAAAQPAVETARALDSVTGAAPVAEIQTTPVASANTQAAIAASDTAAAAPADSNSGQGPAPVSGLPASSAPTSSGPTPAVPMAAGPIPAAPGAALPDSFLGPFWTVVTPAGGSASISNGHLFLGVPGGSNHDLLLPSNQAVRVVQAIGNEDFDVAIKIDSPLYASDANTSQGLMVLADNHDFLTFALTTDGSKIGLKAYTVSGGVASTVLDDAAFSPYQNPIYLRLTRTGSAYVAFYSIDGVSWTQATSFTYTTVPTSIGPFASNYNDTPANTVPVVMSVNWFDVQQ
jgi:hypothetical protein